MTESDPNEDRAPSSLSEDEKAQIHRIQRRRSRFMKRKAAKAPPEGAGARHYAKHMSSPGWFPTEGFGHWMGCLLPVLIFIVLPGFVALLAYLRAAFPETFGWIMPTFRDG